MSIHILDERAQEVNCERRPAWLPLYEDARLVALIERTECAQDLLTYDDGTVQVEFRLDTENASIWGVVADTDRRVLLWSALPTGVVFCARRHPSSQAAIERVSRLASIIRDRITAGDDMMHGILGALGVSMPHHDPAMRELWRAKGLPEDTFDDWMASRTDSARKAELVASYYAERGVQ